ncbi:MAG: 3-deoxy-manno-octulosonate cytidylyltransferase [Bacteroidales bacterium]|jgi:3-deoxy-manno-octulosonate cytidylyltransferase (CMP-KDO synthetase)|nr:3-deoxy-manno-octulosonate cytidylyltransferase [Bacteroidales bacterium]MDD3754915.1 3-deoxy-manno-octulosonate cytidylyltransferase [Bacteroidales bacterium]MDY0401220.1 3-deoxy-manno-octulosonate cytidylyltransferase [Bacteroidales bacterium]HOB77865.1 3-deoxy-manno-octulosonate cytidylyltransferase [Bacteroidales bacterium]HPZ61230.1 3-deoxy-manno-octulosonate cytidylyltransferase [Bacteroidales bacterium]
MNDFWAIIPARYGSTRFPGKPLAIIFDKPMIIHVLDNISKSEISNIFVATDNEVIYDIVNKHDYNAIMTNIEHKNGSERVNEAANILKIPDDDFIINIQGDEPFISYNLINDLKNFVIDKNINLATAATNFNDFEDLFSPNNIKVVTNKNSKALYFSRSIIPYNRDKNHDEWLNVYPYKKHIGIYVYQKLLLEKLISLNTTLLEQTEQLEQLRWLDHGYEIYVMDTDYQSVSVDTPEDIKKIELLR